MTEIAHKKSIVALEKEERSRQYELTKKARALERASKEAAKTIKALDKEKRELTLKKWKEDDDGGLRKKILKCVSQGGPYSKHIPHAGDPILWQNKINQKIAKAKLIAKKSRKENGVSLPYFPPLLEVLWFYGYKSLPFAPTIPHPMP